jgi:hypothetical protein
MKIGVPKSIKQYSSVLIDISYLFRMIDRIAQGA